MFVAIADSIATSGGPVTSGPNPFASFVPGLSDLVAVVAPSFTAAAYSPGAFYSFYASPTNVSRLSVNLTRYLALHPGLEWGDSKALYQYVKNSTLDQSKLRYLTDQQVDSGALFRSHVRLYRAVVIGHEEYVTQAEYFQFQAFVASGGLIVSMDANNFWAKVNYSRTSGTVTLVLGHGWSFDGKTALRSEVHPFEARNSNWTGSSYCCLDLVEVGTPILSSHIGAALAAGYGRAVFTQAVVQEVNTVRNFTDTTLIVKWLYTGVYAYEHAYKSGHFISFGGFASKSILQDRSVQAFLLLSLQKR